MNENVGRAILCTDVIAQPRGGRFKHSDGRGPYRDDALRGIDRGCGRIRNRKLFPMHLVLGDVLHLDRLKCSGARHGA